MSSIKCPACDGYGWDRKGDDDCWTCEGLSTICGECRHGWPNCRCDMVDEPDE